MLFFSFFFNGLLSVQQTQLVYCSTLNVDVVVSFKQFFAQNNFVRASLIHSYKCAHTMIHVLIANSFFKIYFISYSRTAPVEKEMFNFSSSSLSDRCCKIETKIKTKEKQKRTLRKQRKQKIWTLNTFLYQHQFYEHEKFALHFARLCVPYSPIVFKWCLGNTVTQIFSVNMSICFFPVLHKQNFTRNADFFLLVWDRNTEL